jgi:hypothetical protein
MCAPQPNNQVEYIKLDNVINNNEQQYEQPLIIRFTFRAGKINWNQIYKTLFWLCFLLFFYLKKVYGF